MAKNLLDNPIPTTLFTQSLPMIWGMFAVIIGTAADSYFLGKLGVRELAAIGLISPIVLIIGSISIGLGVAVSSLVSRSIGEKKFHQVQRYTTDSLLLALIIISTLVIVGIITITPLFSLMGATPELLPLIHSYLMIYYPSTIFLLIPMIGNGAIRATGNTFLPAMIMTLTAFCNVILDPLLIFGFDFIPAFGMKGAAIAAFISRSITMLWALHLLKNRFQLLSFKFIGIKGHLNTFKDILKLSLPSTLTNLVVPTSMAIITALISRLGTDITAGFGVASRIESLFFIIMYGIGAGTSAFFGQNWGAQKFDRVNRALKLMMSFTMLYGFIMTFFFYIYGKRIAYLFADKESVISVTYLYLLIVAPTYAFEGIRLINSNVMSAIGMPKYPTFVMSLRMFILYVPLAIISSKFFGLIGVFASASIANLLAGCVGIYLNFKFIPKKMVRIATSASL